MHNHGSFSLRFHKLQRDYTNAHLVAVGTQTVTINKLTLLFFTPSHNNSFLDRMIADQAWGTDIFFSVVSHVSIGLWQSVCVCVYVCVRGRHGLRRRGVKAAQTHLWVRWVASAWGRCGRPCLLHGDQQCELINNTWLLINCATTVQKSFL